MEREVEQMGILNQRLRDTSHKCYLTNEEKISSHTKKGTFISYSFYIILFRRGVVALTFSNNCSLTNGTLCFIYNDKTTHKNKINSNRASL